ncbi:MAG: exodeoxyribonuclease I [Wenzhouxiangellaceae bacterium]
MNQQQNGSRAGFLFYDYETFGTHPARDRIAQFGALRTDDELNPSGEPQIIYCQPGDDLLPHPDACVLTGITPQQALRRGEKEWSFAERVHALMAQPNTCTLGYNSYRFDDEFTRYLFYRNAIDPYAREYQDGNSRYDLIDLLRLCYALRPQGIEWPMHDDGRPSFRLEDLTSANHIEHGQAHDAMADVYATIAMAKLVKDQQPRLWRYALSLRDRYQAEDLLSSGEPLIHASSRFPSSQGGVSLVLPLGRHPRIRNQYVVFNLVGDPEAFCTLPLEDLAERLYTPSADLPDDVERLPLKTIKINRAPVLAPLATLKGVDTARIQLNVEQCQEHARRLRQCSDLSQRLNSLYASDPWPEASDPEAALYDGFIERQDRQLLDRLRHQPPAQWPTIIKRLSDNRLPEVMFRTRARNFPETLTDEEQQRWQAYRYQRLLQPEGGGSLTVPEYQQRIAELRDSGAAAAILDELEAWLWELRISDLEQAFEQ